MSLTHELRILFPEQDPASLSRLKDDVKNFLIGLGEVSFVEGVVEGLDLVFEYEKGDHSHYEEHGGSAAPISVYKYDLSHLKDLRAKLEATFGKRIQCEEASIATEVWQEGWKEGFKPIETAKFFVTPPWDASDVPSGKIPLIIDPGMAFGTGQHETTRLCLEEIEQLNAKGGWSERSVLDAGTGSGILAIAARKLGSPKVLGTDIDPDAMKAARENAAANAVDIDLFLGSLPDKGTYDVVLANILGITLLKMVDDLAKKVAKGGHLILSGLLTSEIVKIRRVYETAGLQYVREGSRGDWAVLTFLKA